MSKLSKEIQNKIVDLYNKKHGSPYIANELGLGQGQVSYFISKNIGARSHREANSKYSFNENFFNQIDTEEKLGFSANKYYKRRDYQKVMSLEFGGNLKTQKILDLLYKDASIYLDRKYNRYIDLCNLNNSRALEKSKA